MRSLLCAAALVGVVAMLSGCAGMYSAPVVPGMAWLYADVKAPLDTNVNATKLGSKVGEASAENILGWIVSGDASTKAAAAQGQITTINHLDYQFKNILGIYAKFTTIVYGD